MPHLSPNQQCQSTECLHMHINKPTSLSPAVAWAQTSMTMIFGLPASDAQCFNGARSTATSTRSPSTPYTWPLWVPWLRMPTAIQSCDVWSLSATTDHNKSLIRKYSAAGKHVHNTMCELHILSIEEQHFHNVKHNTKNTHSNSQFTGQHG